MSGLSGLVKEENKSETITPVQISVGVLIGLAILVLVVVSIIYFVTRKSKIQTMRDNIQKMNNIGQPV